MSQIVGASFLYEKTWTVLFIIYFQLYSLVVTDISKHVNDIKMHYTVFTKKEIKEEGRGLRGGGGGMGLEERTEVCVTTLKEHWRECFSGH